MLDGPHPVVPVDLVPRAAARGRRAVRRRRVARYALWALLLAAAVAGLVLAAVFWPDRERPATTPAAARGGHRRDRRPPRRPGRPVRCRTGGVVHRLLT